MKTSIILPVILIAVLAAGAAFFVLNKNKSVETVPVTAPQTQEAVMPKEAVVQNNTEKISAGAYVDYSTTALAKATANNGKAVLFFHAKWCPTCKAANENIVSKLDQIPKNLTILKTDYDTEKKLKEKYGITYQHTFVQIDATGKELAKWNGGGLDEILAHLQ